MYKSSYIKNRTIMTFFIVFTAGLYVLATKNVAEQLDQLSKEDQEVVSTIKKDRCIVCLEEDYTAKSEISCCNAVICSNCWHLGLIYYKAELQDNFKERDRLNKCPHCRQLLGYDAINEETVLTFADRLAIDRIREQNEIKKQEENDYFLAQALASGEMYNLDIEYDDESESEENEYGNFDFDYEVNTDDEEPGEEDEDRESSEESSLGYGSNNKESSEDECAHHDFDDMS